MINVSAQRTVIIVRIGMRMMRMIKEQPDRFQIHMPSRRAPRNGEQDGK